MTAVVARVGDAHGSHIEPPLDEDWDDLTKLQWQAAVVSADTGLDIEVIEFPTNFCIHIRSTTGGTLASISSQGLRDTWTYLSGIASGASAATMRHAGRGMTEAR